MDARYRSFLLQLDSRHKYWIKQQVEGNHFKLFRVTRIIRQLLYIWRGAGKVYYLLCSLSLTMAIDTVNERVGQIAAHLIKAGSSLQDKVCIVTGAGSIYGIG